MQRLIDFDITNKYEAFVFMVLLHNEFGIGFHPDDDVKPLARNLATIEDRLILEWQLNTCHDLLGDEIYQIGLAMQAFLGYRS